MKMELNSSIKVEKEEKKEDVKNKDGKIDKTAAASAEKTIMLMKKGDYTVHILIEEVRNLISKDPELLVSPVVKITCFNTNKRTTKLKTDVKEYSFSEHFYFEKNNLSVEELDSQKIIIEVYDNHNTKREDYLGIYEFDFTFVYNNEKHSLHNFWVALANPEGEDLTKVRGYLKLSASILMEKDDRTELVSKKDDPNSMCVVPPQIKMEYIQLNIHLIKAEQLPDMDPDIIGRRKKVNRGCNGYIRAKFMGLNIITSVKDMKNDMIIWNEIIEIPVIFPVVSQKIVMSVWDQDLLSTDDIVGSFEINVNDVLGNINKYEKEQYINIYGAPLDTMGKYTDKMNLNPEIGSLWKGRVLMYITFNKTDNPKSRSKPIEDPLILKKIGGLGKPNRWDIDIKLYDAFFLPKDGAYYTVKICLAEEKVESPSKKCIKKNIKFEWPTSLFCHTLTDKVNEVPDLFIYLVDDNQNNICFQRISASTFYQNNDILIVKLLPDPSVDKIEEACRSGLVKLQIHMKNEQMNFPITIGNNMPKGTQGKDQPVLKLLTEEEEEDLEQEAKRLADKLKKKTIEKPKLYTIIANIHMSRYILAGDANGTSDPYVTLKIGDEELKTNTINDVLNAIWNKSLEFKNQVLDINDKSTWPIMFLQVKDQDNITDDLLAYNYIWLSDSSYEINSKDILVPKWHQLRLPTSNRPQGELLCSFIIIDQDREDITSLPTKDITPETILYSCEINILGLRDLKPLSMLPVKKAFIVFDLNSINISGQTDNNLKSIKTQPKSSGPHPTINTVIKFDINLPKNPIFMPDMQCCVYDYLLAGLYNQMLGVFVVPLQEIIESNSEQIKQDMHLTDKKLGLFVVDKSMLQLDDINIKVNQGNLDPEKRSHSQVRNTEFPARMIQNTSDKYLGENDNVIGQKNNYNALMNDSSRDVKLNIEMVQNKDSDRTHLLANNYMSSGILDPNNSHNFVIYPFYKKYILPGTKKGPKYKEFDIEDDDKAPDDKLYKAVGYNKYKEDQKKHYRRIYSTELEHVKELELESPFYKFPLRRGKFQDQSEETGIFEAMSNQENKIIKRFKQKGGEEVHTEVLNKEVEEVNNIYEDKQYGDFKGLIRIVEKQQMLKYVEMIKTIRSKKDKSLLKDFKYLTNFEDISKRILVEKEVVVRIYILYLGDLAKKDLFSDSDPFIKLYLGNEMIDESLNHQEDKKNCDWCKCYDMTTTLPGNGSLKLEVWDNDPIFADDLIGSTRIDIEDRFFDHTWQELKDKPIETRMLKHPDLEGIQGYVTLWVEVFEKSERNGVRKWDISPPPQVNLEMRLIVWETEDIPLMDVEGTSDIYVVAFVDANVKQSTDMHFRCQDGKGSFNWRVVLPLDTPSKDTQLHLQVFDNDFFSYDDFISGSVLELRKIISDVYKLDVPIKFTKDYWDGLTANERNNVKIEFRDGETEKFWFDMQKQGVNGMEKGGKVLLSLEILPNWKAQICLVGKGRDEPNVNPHLPPPIGRFEWSLNPFKMLNQCVGPEYRRKIYLAIIGLYCIFFLPYLILHLSAEALNPFNYNVFKKI